LFQVSRWGTHVLGVSIFDASGHGVAAALRAVALSSFLREDNVVKLSSSFDPGLIVTEANRLFPLSADGDYFTLWVGRLDLTTWSLSYATAGHSGAVVQRETGCRWLIRESFPLGFDSDARFVSQDIALRPFDRLFLFSDGLYEAPSTNGELWGRARLEDGLVAHRRHGMADCVERTIAAARIWQGSSHFPDDVALLGLEIGEPAASSQGGPYGN
jgi:phosphoserine phosphatase RsbU/P